MAVLSGRASLSARLPIPLTPFLGATLVAPVALGIGRALPAEGAGLGLRLAAAGALVLIVPGALVLRAFGWHSRLATTIAGGFVLSLACCYIAFTLTFAAGASLSLTVVVLGATMAGALLPALRLARVQVGRAEVATIGALALVGLLIGVAAWWASHVLAGEELFHLARVRKLDEVPALYSVGVTNEFRDGSVHPGYAFPLWHGVLALVTRLAGVDPGQVVLHLGTMLIPLALVLAYAAGTELFASTGGGVATAVAQTAIAGFPRGGIGAFREIALPRDAALLLVVPAVLALVFRYVAAGRRGTLACVAVAALVLATVRATDAVLVCIPLAGFLAVRLLVPEGRGDARRIGACLGALLVPAGLYFAWLWPYADAADAFLPSSAQNAAAAAARSSDVSVYGSLLALSPRAVAVGGAGLIAGLLAAGAAGLLPQRRWAGYVLGGSVAVLVAALVPPVFTGIADVGTLPVALALPSLLPLPFALAGLALVVARRPILACLGAVGLGLGLALAYGHRGVAWATWLAVAGVVCGVAAAALPRARQTTARLATQTAGAGSAVVVTLAFVIPVAAVGLSSLERDRPDPRALPSGLVEAVRARVPVRGTVFADLETSYRLAASAPVYIVAAPPRYVAGTAGDRPYDRRRAVIDFFYRETLQYDRKAQILASNGASWLLVDTTRPYPRYVTYLPKPVYDDGRYRLYDLRR
jgi:hypothetical protein